PGAGLEVEAGQRLAEDGGEEGAGPVAVDVVGQRLQDGPCFGVGAWGDEGGKGGGERGVEGTEPAAELEELMDLAEVHRQLAPRHKEATLGARKHAAAPGPLADESGWRLRAGFLIHGEGPLPGQTPAATSRRPGILGRRGNG